MTDEISKDESSNTPAPSQMKSPKKFGKMILILLLIIFLIALALFAFKREVYFRTIFKKQLVAYQHLEETQNDRINGLANQFQNLSDSLQKALSISSEQEKLINEWRAAEQGNLNKWQIAEALYLVKLANDQLKFTQQLPLAISLLQKASEEIASIAPLVQIRQSLLSDISNLQSQNALEIENLYQKALLIDSEIDQLPLPPVPVKPETSHSTDTEGLSWWRRGLNHTWSLLKSVIVVKRNGDEITLFEAPEEKIYLYQNLHAEVQSILWGILRQNNTVYHAGLGRTIAWVQKYFAKTEPQTMTMIEQLQNMQQINFQPYNFNLDHTIALFNEYLDSTHEKNKSQ